MEDGTVHDLRPACFFDVPPGPGHDSWVVSDERYVSLHFLSAEQYAKK
jgi:hypothetical protein